MVIGAVGYSPYVYRVNSVSAASLNRVPKIGDDLLASKTDFSELTREENETINPLKRGETPHFADILTMQLQMGRMKADHLLGHEPLDSGGERGTVDMAIGIETVGDTGAGEHTAEASLYQMRHAAEAYQVGGSVWTA